MFSSEAAQTLSPLFDSLRNPSLLRRHSHRCCYTRLRPAPAYFVVGPATRIAPMVTVCALVRKEIFLLHFLVTVVGGIGLGLLYGIL